MYATWSKYWREFFSAKGESWKKLKTSNLFSSFIGLNSILFLYIHSVAISEFPKWQTLFHLQKFKYIKN